MDRYTRFISTSSIALVSLFVSCEIEDDFGKPDLSEDLGVFLYSGGNPINKLLWSEGTNEILIATNLFITAIDIDTHAKRSIEFNNAFMLGVSSWLSGNTIYYIDYDARLSSFNLANKNVHESFVDSVSIPYGGIPFTGRHFAFVKWKAPDEYQPLIYLYDLQDEKEIFIAPGDPITFSQDGLKLLFEKPDEYGNKNYYYYDIATQEILPLSIIDPSPYYDKVIRWPLAGILFFYLDDHSAFSIRLDNLTTTSSIGVWESNPPLSSSRISPSGDKMIISSEGCANPYAYGTCEQLKETYSLVNIGDNSVVEIANGNYLGLDQILFLPGEHGIAYSNANKVYLAGPKD